MQSPKDIRPNPIRPIRNQTIEIWLSLCLFSVSAIVLYWFAKQARPSVEPIRKRPMIYYFTTNQNGVAHQWVSPDGTNWTALENPMRIPPTNWVKLPAAFTVEIK